MKRSVVARYLLGVASGASLLLATASEAGAKTYPLACGPFVGGFFAALLLQNTTGRPIPCGARISITVCVKSGCRTWEGFASQIPMSGFYRCDKSQPGEFVLWTPDDAKKWPWPPTNSGWPEGVTGCSATVNIPEPFQEKPKPSVKEFSRTRPPGPPQPGLLESNPGYSPQGPSGVGTPAKPSAPPPSAPPAPSLR